MGTPRVLIPDPTTADGAYNDRCWPEYAAAIREAGGEAVRLTLTLSAAEQATALRGCEAICLPGSPADVDPAKYGAERDAATAAADPEREATDYLLLTEAWKAGVPVLGVCFGCQSLNVWRGGTMVQDLQPVPVNHAPPRSVGLAHSVLTPATSMLGELITSTVSDSSEWSKNDLMLRYSINSSHHQAILAPGDDLRIVARCPEDGVIEAIELDSSTVRDGFQGRRFVLGVQWHPERSTAISGVSRAIFTRLVAEAGAFARRRV